MSERSGPSPTEPMTNGGIMDRIFIDKDGRVPVASPRLGTAHPGCLKRALRRLGLSHDVADEPEDSGFGLLIHGPARIGKSSLVAQILDRLPDARTVVIPGPFDTTALLELVVDALGDAEARQRLERYRFSPPYPDELEDLLTSFLDRFSHENPLIIVLDRLDSLLRANDSPPRRLRDQSREPVLLLFRALRRSTGQARLVVTSRSVFTVPDRGNDLTDHLALIEVPRPEPEVTRRLIEEAVSRSRPPGDDELKQRILRNSLGHPGLVDLLCRLASAMPDILDGVLATLESYLNARGEVPEDEIPEVAAFFESLIYERLAQGLNMSERDLLRLSTSFEAPAPLAIVAEFAERFGLLNECLPDEGGLERSRLVVLGLWDLVHRSGDAGPELHVVPNRVARQWAGTLDDEERPAVAMHLIQLYVDAWLPTPDAVAEPERCLQLCRLAVHAADPEILDRVLAPTIELLQRRLESQRAHDLGMQALQLIGKSRFELGSVSLLALAELCFRLSRPVEGAGFLDRAAGLSDREPVQQARFDRSLAAVKAADGELDEAFALLRQAADGFDAEARPWDVAATLSVLADVHVAGEDLEAALAARRQELDLVDGLDEVRRRISVLGHMANLHAALEQRDQALASHESALESSRSLGADHLTASIQAEIARLLLEQGQFDAASDLHRLRLQHFDTAGDLVGRAHALWSMARIELQRGHIDAAMGYLVEAYHINQELDLAEGIGLVGLDYGQVLWAAGMMGEARLILERSVESFRRSGDPAMQAQAQAILDELSEAS